MESVNLTLVLATLSMMFNLCRGQYAANETDLLAIEKVPNSTYVIWDKDGQICTLAKFSMTFQIFYQSIQGEKQITVNNPKNATVEGHCGMWVGNPRLELSWEGFRLIMVFTLDSDRKYRETWELWSMELVYDTSTPLFVGATNVRNHSFHTLDSGIFETRFGKSYYCPYDDVIPMYGPIGEKVVLVRMKDVHLQVHDVQMGKFSPSQKCGICKVDGISHNFAQDGIVSIAPPPDKPVMLKYPVSTPGEDVLTIEKAPNSTYALWDEHGKICVLAKFSMTLHIVYLTIHGEKQIAVDVPKDAKVGGSCTSSLGGPLLTLAWSGFFLSMDFMQAYPEENPATWELHYLDLVYDTMNPFFDGATDVGKRLFHLFHPSGLFKTQHGKSYFCPSPEDIKLHEMYPLIEGEAVLARMKDIHLQAYDVQNGKFSPSRTCRICRKDGQRKPFSQDGIVTFAAGHTLASSALSILFHFFLLTLFNFYGF